MLKNAIFICLLLLSFNALSNSEMPVGRLLDNNYKDICFATLVGNNKVVTNHHCVVDRQGDFIDKLFVFINGKIIAVIPPLSFDWVDLTDVENLKIDKIILDLSENALMDFADLECESQPVEMKLFFINDDKIDIKKCDFIFHNSGIMTSTDCYLDKSNSGSPIFINDSGKYKICGIYSHTIKSKNKGIGIGVQLKREDLNVR